ncbi:MAG: mannosyltransferase [Actinomycetes bacterium]|jgi:uncharacterized membrane protein
MKLKFTTKAVILLAVVASLLSFAKFDHCYKTNWASPDVYVHACYSDLPALFGARDLIHHTWPYSSSLNAVEYPPLTGVVMWATSLVTPGGNNSYRYYFLINLILLGFLLIGTSLIMAKLKPDFRYLLPLSPAVILSLYINWDMWAVITAVAAIYWFERKFFTKSAIALGISVATKFFPIVLLVPVALIFIRRNQLKRALQYSAFTLLTWLIINLPFILFNQSGWWRFFKLNGERSADFGSLWYSLQLLGIFSANGNLNTISLLTFLVGIAAFAVYFFGLARTPTLASCAFTIVAIFTIASKVYSPQYVLWLTPLAILAMRGAQDRKAFWIWQGSEVLYHVAVWEYLAKFSGTHFGLEPKAYAIIALIRIAATIYFVTAVSTRSRAPQMAEFLTSSVVG